MPQSAFSTLNLFNVGKHPEEPRKSQDAVDVNETMGLYAIADGVSRSFFPDIWSKLIVYQFCEASHEMLDRLFEGQGIASWLSPLQKHWRQFVAEKIEISGRPELRNRLLKRDNAATTFVGLQIYPYQHIGKWRAIIVGDSLLMHIRSNQLLGSHIKNHPSQFSSFPDTIKSYPGDQFDTVKIVMGEWEHGDEFILVTDAIGQWMLTQNVQGRRAWEKSLRMFREMKSLVEFYRFVVRQRKDRRNPLEVDDTAIIYISSGYKQGRKVRRRFLPAKELVREKQVQPSQGITWPSFLSRLRRRKATIWESYFDEKPSPASIMTSGKAQSSFGHIREASRAKRRLPAWARIVLLVLAVAALVALLYQS